MNDRQKRLVQNLVGVYAFYQRELDEFSIRIWADACAEFDICDIEAAFARHLKDPDAGRWCPKPADIVRQIRGDVDEAALIAWGQVLECVRSGRSDRVDGAARAAVQSMGGLSVIGRSDESQNGFLQRRFCEAFKVYHRRESEEAALLTADVIGRLK
jgi:hypothetical protein